MAGTGFEVHGVSFSSCVDSGQVPTAPACPPRAATGCNAARPAAGKVTTDEWFTFDVMTDADLSMLGEARHKTIGGRGVVGRMIDKVTK